MGFSYPLTFENEEDHIHHVKNNNTFYEEILMEYIKRTTKDEDEQNKVEEEKKKVEQEQKKVEEEKKKVEQQQKEVEEEKKKVEQQQKEVKEEKMKVEKEQKKVEDEKKEVEKGKEQVESANRLLKRKEKNDAVESTAKGKTFEEKIIYMLKEINREENLGFKIDDNNKTKACDIRFEYRELLIGIEAKDKKKITKDDINKFNRDRIMNNFAGAIFWSKESKIHGGEDTGEGDNYFNISNDKCLFLRGNDFDRSVYIIFTYAKFLFLMKNQETPSQDISDMISKMFNMISLQYTQFGKLKKEVQTLDVMFKKNLEMIDHMCEENNLKPPKKNFKLEKSTLVVVPFRDALSTIVYENKELQELKSKPSKFFDSSSYSKKRKSDDLNGDLHSSPNKAKFSDSSGANNKLGNVSGDQSSPIKVSDDERDE